MLKAEQETNGTWTILEGNDVIVCGEAEKDKALDRARRILKIQEQVEQESSDPGEL
jgi:hypothetical protein